VSDALTDFGFTYGPAEVTRVSTLNRGKQGTWRVLNVKTPHRSLDIYVSPTGRSVRVFDMGKLGRPELLPEGDTVSRVMRGRS
jgi:hypothetical protein